MKLVHLLSTALMMLSSMVSGAYVEEKVIDGVAQHAEIRGIPHYDEYGELEAYFADEENTPVDEEELFGKKCPKGQKKKFGRCRPTSAGCKAGYLKSKRGNCHKAPKGKKPKCANLKKARACFPKKKKGMFKKKPKSFWTCNKTCKKKFYDADGVQQVIDYH